MERRRIDCALRSAIERGLRLTFGTGTSRLRLVPESSFLRTLELSRVTSLEERYLIPRDPTRRRMRASFWMTSDSLCDSVFRNGGLDRSQKRGFFFGENCAEIED
jgi:hypothetical protein